MQIRNGEAHENTQRPTPTILIKTDSGTSICL